MRAPSFSPVLLTSILLAGVPAASASAATAPADGFTCEASALSLRVLGAPALEPAVANRGATACQDATATLARPLPLPLSGGAAAARTTATDGSALAVAGLGGVHLRAADMPGLTLPLSALPASLGSVTVPLGGTQAVLDSTLGTVNTVVNGVVTTATGTTGGVTGTVGGVVGTVGGALPHLRGAATRSVLPASTLPSAMVIDVRPAVQSLLAALPLPSTDLLSVANATGYAGATCASGTPSFRGGSAVSGVRVLGQDVADGSTFDRSVPLVDSTTLDMSAIDLTKIPLPAGLSLADTLPLGATLAEAIRGALAKLPPVQSPATLARVIVTPGAQARVADGLVQQALRVQVSVLGKDIVDLGVGRAAVRGACLRSAPTSASGAALACTKRRLVLVDVARRGDRVRLQGAADRALAGKRVDILFGAARRVVAHARVSRSGAFSTTAALPARSVRATNAARYQARVGRERSLDLKLERRMILRTIRSARGKVTIAGRITGPLGHPARAIALTHRVSCRNTEVVKRFRPDADGTFRVTVPAPRGRGAAVYRLGTQVRKTTRNPKLFPTFTLPRAVELG